MRKPISEWTKTEMTEQESTRSCDSGEILLPYPHAVLITTKNVIIFVNIMCGEILDDCIKG